MVAWTHMRQKKNLGTLPQMLFDRTWDIGNVSFPLWRWQFFVTCRFLTSNLRLLFCWQQVFDNEPGCHVGHLRCTLRCWWSHVTLCSSRWWRLPDEAKNLGGFHSHDESLEATLFGTPHDNITSRSRSSFCKMCTSGSFVCADMFTRTENSSFSTLVYRISSASCETWRFGTARAITIWMSDVVCGGFCFQWLRRDFRRINLVRLFLRSNTHAQHASQTARTPESVSVHLCSWHMWEMAYTWFGSTIEPDLTIDRSENKTVVQKINSRLNFAACIYGVSQVAILTHLPTLELYVSYKIRMEWRRNVLVEGLGLFFKHSDIWAGDDESLRVFTCSESWGCLWGAWSQHLPRRRRLLWEGRERQLRVVCRGKQRTGRINHVCWIMVGGCGTQSHDPLCAPEWHMLHPTTRNTEQWWRLQGSACFLIPTSCQPTLWRTRVDRCAGSSSSRKKKVFFFLWFGRVETSPK